jgi:hypothetical protein
MSLGDLGVGCKAKRKVETISNVSQSPKEGYGSKSNVLLMMMILKE